MATTARASSLKDYLKKYESSNNKEEEKKKKKKKKAKPVASGVLVVDEDPVWQKPVNIEEEEEEDSPDEKPQVNEDIEVKRMKRLEQIRMRRAYNQISEDGSGWVSVSENNEKPSISGVDPSSDMSPPRKRVARYDTPSPDAREDPDLSPPRQRRTRNDSLSPEPEGKPSGAHGEESDLSPPRQRRRRHDSPPLGGSKEDGDLSPPRNRSRRYDSPSPERGGGDLSPPRRRGKSSGFSSLPEKKDTDLDDLSPPRRGPPSSSKIDASRGSEDLSPPRKSRKDIGKLGPSDGAKHKNMEADLSPPRKRKVQLKTGLITGKEVSEEIAKTKKDELLRFQEMDPSTSGRGAEGVYRIKGQRVSKEEYLKLTKKEEKPKEDKKLEWGKGLAQKREAEARLTELELEKDKPFARSRDDPELDRVMKDQLRWGDPMAHLVKKKHSDIVLHDLGASEKMKESGFIVPQEIPSHSWLKRGLDFEPNRYGIKPGRHWDGVNRSNGYEKQMFKKMSEKRATEREAYLWSVSDM